MCKRYPPAQLKFTPAPVGQISLACDAASIFAVPCLMGGGEAPINLSRAFKSGWHVCVQREPWVPLLSFVCRGSVDAPLDLQRAFEL